MEEEEKEIAGLKESIEGWKENTPLESKGFLTWENDLVFTARIRGYQFEYDAKAEQGCWPTDTLLMSIAGCLAIDVITFLKKMRAEIKDFEIETKGSRNPYPPQYFKSMDIIIHISGKDITPKKLDRAISFSQDKYCSVYHTLREDMELNIRYEIKTDDQ